MKPFLGLVGILIAAMTAEFNDQVTSIALVDVRGAFGIRYDPGTWIQSLYVSAEIIGMAMSPLLLVTFTLRRWTAVRVLSSHSALHTGGSARLVRRSAGRTALRAFPHARLA